MACLARSFLFASGDVVSEVDDDVLVLDDLVVLEACPIREVWNDCEDGSEWSVDCGDP